MRNGKQVINHQISEDSIKEALDSLVSPNVRLSNAHVLCTLVMVDLFLSNPDLPAIENPREFAVQQILIDIITEQYTEQRGIFQFDNPKTITTQKQAISAIQQDSNVESVELMGWCTLYFQYVRVNLNLTLPEFSEKAGLVARTLRRYRANSIRRLRDTIIHKEWETRADQRYLRLITQFPEITPRKLFGRDEQFRQCTNLIKQKFNANVFVTGMEGIGKTVFVQETIRQLWDSDDIENIDYLVWLNEPSSTEDVRDALHKSIGFENLSINTREFLVLYRVIIVIDGLINLDLPSLKTIFNLFDPALIFIVNRENKVVTPVDLHINLTPLEYPIVIDYVQYLLHSNRKHAEFDSESLSHWIFEAIGGNPLGIQLMVDSPFEWDQSNTTIPAKLVEKTYNTLTTSQQNLCICLALFPNKPVALGTIIELLSGWGEMEQGDLRVLVNYNLAIINNVNTSNMLKLHQVVRRYIYDVILHSENQFPVADFVRHVAQYVTLNPQLVSEIFLQALQQVPALYDIVIQIVHGQILSNEVSRSQEWSILITTLVKMEEGKQDDILLLEYCSILRREGKLKQVENVLQNLIQNTGRGGHFLIQINAMIELCIVYRLLGKYSEALNLLDIAFDYSARHKQKQLQINICLEKAQIGLDRGQGDTALQHLNEIPENMRNVEWCVMMAEAKFLNGEYEDCVEIIDEQTNMISSRHFLGRFYDLLGKNYAVQGDFRGAHKWFNIAIQYLNDETSINTLSLLRAKSNLGATLIKLGKFDESEILLNRIEKEQQAFEDKIALAITKHNLHLLYQARDNQNH